MLPLGGASLFVASLVVPSFVFLEPYRTGESIAVLGGLLACAGLVIVVSGVALCFIAWRRTARFVTAHSPTDELRVEDFDTPALGIKTAMPIVLIAGIHRPKLLISEGATGLLEPAELQVAIQHELAHVVSRDNLKKLVIHCVKFPFMKQLERDWLQATEYAADDAAAISESAAVDLASALLKVAGHSGATGTPELAMSLVRDADDALGTRVARLLSWQGRRASRSRSRKRLFISIVSIAMLASIYMPVLKQIHEATELLVR